MATVLLTVTLRRRAFGRYACKIRRGAGLVQRRKMLNDPVALP